MGELSIILHGGAWTPEPDARDGKERPALAAALDAGWRALSSGVPGERAVVEALRVLEDCEYLDAGYGSFPDENGEVFTDVALMRGCGDFISLLGLSHVRHPSALALDLLQPGARLMTIWTARRAAALRTASDEAKERYGYVIDNAELVSPYARAASERARLLYSGTNKGKAVGHDTVGCVVRDSRGKIFAGTSTGGIAFKPDGRVGDAPIIAAGVFADDEICGLSATGDGEQIMQSMLSGFVVAEVRRAQTLDAGCFESNSETLQLIISDELARMRRRFPGAEAGMIVMPKSGDPVFEFNSEMMCVAMRSGTPSSVRKELVQVALRC